MILKYLLFVPYFVGNRGKGNALIIIPHWCKKNAYSVGFFLPRGLDFVFSIQSIRTVEVLEVSSWSWRPGPDLPAGLAASGGLQMGETMLLVGGYRERRDLGRRRRSLYSRCAEKISQCLN